MQPFLQQFLVDRSHIKRHQPLLVLLDGYVDAGHLVEQSTNALQDVLSGETVVDFDIDQLYDYRSRRPRILFNGTHFTDYQTPLLHIDQLEDIDGHSMLLLHGAEPDFQWERFMTALCDVIVDLRVSEVIWAQSVPMPTPHTRPTLFTVSGSDSERVEAQSAWRPSSMMPASFSAYLESKLIELDVPVTGYSAHTPHYLADTVYPVGMVALLETLAEALHMHWDLDDARGEAQEFLSALDEQAKDNEEFQRQIAALEVQHDEFVEKIAQQHELQHLPTADELGAEFEAFLANQHPGDID